MSDHEIIEVTSQDDRIAGWYVSVTHAGGDNPANWTWRDVGNGPEVATDDVHGPFPSKDSAEEWWNEAEAEERCVRNATMTEKHTPKPWRLILGPDGEPNNIQSVDTVVCTFPVPGRGDAAGFEETLANARLIAAAPDLLAACRSALSLWKPRPGLPTDVQQRFRTAVENDPTLREVRAAIAKATGGES